MGDRRGVGPLLHVARRDLVAGGVDEEAHLGEGFRRRPDVGGRGARRAGEPVGGGPPSAGGAAVYTRLLSPLWAHTLRTPTSRLRCRKGRPKVSSSSCQPPSPPASASWSAYWV